MQKIINTDTNSTALDIFTIFTASGYSFLGVQNNVTAASVFLNLNVYTRPLQTWYTKSSELHLPRSLNIPT